MENITKLSEEVRKIVQNSFCWDQVFLSQDQNQQAELNEQMDNVKKKNFY